MELVTWIKRAKRRVDMNASLENYGDAREFLEKKEIDKVCEMLKIGIHKENVMTNNDNHKEILIKEAKEVKELILQKLKEIEE